MYRVRFFDREGHEMIGETFKLQYEALEWMVYIYHHLNPCVTHWELICQ